MMEFLSATQEYLNRYINATELLGKLKELNDSNLVDLIAQIEQVVSATSDTKDDLVNKEIAEIKTTIERLEAINNKASEVPEEVKEQIENLHEKLDIPRDNAERWEKICGVIKNDKQYKNALESLTDLELLELISKDMHAANLIEINEEKYNELVSVGIEKDKREWLWRLAFNYEGEPYDVERIVKYYLDVDDCFYLSELIYIVGHKLNIENIINAVAEKDRKFIEKFIEGEWVVDKFVSKEQMDSLRAKL